MLCTKRALNFTWAHVTHCGVFWRGTYRVFFLAAVMQRLLVEVVSSNQSVLSDEHRSSIVGPHSNLQIKGGVTNTLHVSCECTAMAIQEALLAKRLKEIAHPIQVDLGKGFVCFMKAMKCPQYKTWDFRCRPVARSRGCGFVILEVVHVEGGYRFFPLVGKKNAAKQLQQNLQQLAVRNSHRVDN